MSHAVAKPMMKILVFPSMWQWKLLLWAWSFKFLNTVTGLGKGHLGAVGYSHFGEIRISVVLTLRNYSQSPPPQQSRIQIIRNAYLNVIFLVRMVINIENINLRSRKRPRKSPEFTCYLSKEVAAAMCIWFDTDLAIWNITPCFGPAQYVLSQNIDPGWFAIILKILTGH